MDRLTGDRADGLPSCPTLQIALGIPQARDSLFESIGGIPLRTGPACNLDGVTCLIDSNGTFALSRIGLISAGFTFKVYCPLCKSSYFASTCSIVPVVSCLMEFSMTTTSLGWVTAK